MKIRTIFISAILLLGTAFIFYGNAVSKEASQDKQKVQTRRLNPSVESSDPHWSPGGTSSTCSAVDLIVSSVELRGERSGVFARAKIRNRCSGATERAKNVSFKGPGPAISVDCVGAGWAGPADFWTGWYGIPGDAALRPFVVTVTVDSNGVVRETKEENNSRTARLE